MLLIASLSYCPNVIYTQSWKSYSINSEYYASMHPYNAIKQGSNNILRGADNCFLKKSSMQVLWFGPKGRTKILTEELQNKYYSLCN